MQRGAPVPPGVLLVSRRATVVGPLRATCVAAGLDAITADDAPRALRAAAEACGGTGLAGVVVDVAAVDALAEALCEELRALPGAAEVPVLFVGDDADGPVGSTSDALAVGGDGFFALPVDAGRVVAKLLAYVGGSLPPLPTMLVAGDGPAHAIPARASFAAAATPDELLAALEGATAVVPYDVGGALPGGDDGHDDAEVVLGAIVVDHDTRRAVAFADGATRGDASGLLRDGRGAVAEGGAAALLWATHAARTTGVLELLDDDGVRRGVSLIDGVPVRVRSTVDDEQPDAVLSRLGLVTRARLAVLRAATPRPRLASTLCALLVDAGALLPEERAPAVRAVLVEQLVAFVGGRGGAWQLNTGVDDAFGVDLPGGVASLIVEALRRRFDEPRLHRVVGGPASVFAPTGAVLAASAEAALALDEQRALVAFDGVRCLDEVVTIVGLSPLVVLRSALAGATFGVLRCTHAQPATTSRVADHRGKARELLRERVLERLALARGGDYFRFLSLTTDATPYEVAAAAAALRSRFDPSRALERGLGDVRAALVEIVEVVADAEAVLLDDELRDAYRRRLAS